MSGWILAKGRDAETTLEEVVAAGAMAIPVAGADAIFTPGGLLFVSEADGSETQWLGRVLEVDAEAVSFSRPLARSKNTGALLWQAAQSYQSPADAALPLRRQVDTGVVTRRTLEGTFVAAKVAEPTTSLRLTLVGLTDPSERGLVEWIASALDWGVEPFTLIEPSGDMRVVRLLGEPLTRERAAGDRHALTMPLILVEQGGYQ